MSKSRLKVGFLCGYAPIKQWQLLCIEELSRVEQVDIHLLWCGVPATNNETVLESEKRKFLNRLKKYVLGSRRLWNVYYYLFIRNKISHFRPILDETILKKIPSMNFHLRKQGAFKYAFTSDSLAKVAGEGFDVLINLELGFLTGDILNTPKHGVWSFHHGNEEHYRGLPPAFWEIYNNDPVCGLVLQRLTEELDAGYILEKGFVPSHLRSYRRSLEMLFSVGHQWPAKICRQLLTTDFSTLQTKSTTRAKVYRAPSNKQIIYFIAKLFGRNFKYLFTSFFFAERWRIGVIQKPLQYFVDHDTQDLDPHWLPMAKKTIFMADPFGFESAEGSRIIFESFDYKTRLGTIGTTRFDPKTKKFDSSKIEISKPYHLSYPFVFKYLSKTYCLVETYTQNKLNYFQLQADGSWLPYKEVLSEKLRNDNTLFEHEGLWYLFYTKGEMGANLNLNIAYASSPFGPFTEHLLNPIKIDIRSARAAGALFYKDGLIYRPSQNSVLSYGSSISLHQILKLSPTEYRETFVNKIKPAAHWGGFQGLHTLSYLDQNHTLIDCQKPEWIWTNVFQTFGNLARRFIRRNRKSI